MRVEIRSSHRWLIAAAATLALLGTYTSALQRIENAAYDLATRVLPAVGARGQVVVLALDTPTLTQLGPWPWPHDRIAAVLERLARVRPRAIGLALPLWHAQTPGVLPALEAQAATLPGKAGRDARAWLARLDTDGALARAVARAGNVIVAADAHPGSTGPAVPPTLRGSALAVRELAPTPLPPLLHPLIAPPAPAPLAVQAPIAPLAHAAAGIGVLRSGPHRARALPLVVPVGGALLPSFALRLAVLAAGVPADAISLNYGRGVQAGPLRWRTGPDWRWYPRLGHGFARRAAPPVYSLARWWNGDLPDARLHRRIILIGLTAPGLAATLAGPAGTHFTPVTWSATAVQSLLAGSAIRVPPWFFGLQRALIVILALWLMFLPQRLHGRAGLWIGGALAVLLLNAELLALLTRALWLPLTVPALFLVSTQVVLSLRYRVVRGVETARAEAHAANRALAAQFHSQGRLDDAYERLRGCPLDYETLEALYRLAQEYERRRHYPGALAVYDHLAAHRPPYRDVADRRRRLAAMSERFPAAAEGGNAAGTLVLHDPKVERPTIGRYRLERELGQGSMGMVYLGSDPKISRPVAIKTLPRTQDSGAQAAESEQRFLREARAAGRLQHPNIVTIYDVGEEHDVAYIAMDYVEGEDLSRYTQRKRLLPAGEVLEIGAQVADALAYAHGNGVVHRDIKPGNILYQRETGTVKVTDFGIASLADGTRTRTGTVLGTPAYMSPEQVAGRRVDGASDQFALAVTLYQLLCGQPPFSGDSMAALMYAIGNERHLDIRKRRSGLPACAARLLNTALRKNPRERFPSAAEMAQALRKCRERLPAGRRRARARS